MLSYTFEWILRVRSAVLHSTLKWILKSILLLGEAIRNILSDLVRPFGGGDLSLRAQPQLP